MAEEEEGETMKENNKSNKTYYLHKILQASVTSI